MLRNATLSDAMLLSVRVLYKHLGKRSGQGAVKWCVYDSVTQPCSLLSV